MKLVGIGVLDEFRKKHADVDSQVRAWIKEAEEAEWRTPNDIKTRYRSASFLASNRVIFNLKGDRYRLDTKLSYKSQVVLVIRAGTHAEYSRWKF